MSISDLSAGLALVEEAGAAALGADGPESAMRAIAQRIYAHLGDRTAHEKPGALKSGERQFFVAGTFFVTPDKAWHMLVGNVNFPPEQARLLVPIDGGHPGWVYEHRAKLLLENTDEHGEFRQYLKTSRMGSAIFGPMFWRGEFVGQLIMAAQARYTMNATDLAVICACAQVAAAAWVAHGGPAWLARAYPPANGYKVGQQGLSN
jgi:hypothetical protein